MSNKIPQLLKGFRDFGPDKMPARLLMLEKIRAAFERFGFMPMETPALEYAETLTGKYGAEEKLMYKFQDQGGREVAMRYDLTVPLARFYAANKNDLPKPFKRYAIGPVWRAENTQKGRYREFYQCDVDTIGSASALADAEVIAATIAAIKDLGVREVAVFVNNRKIINGTLKSLGVSEKDFVPVLRLLDKLDKLEEKSVQKELEALGLSKTQVKKLFELLNSSASDAKELQSRFGELLLESRELAIGVGELADVLDYLASLKVPGVVADLKLARGLDYYTGTVCEMRLPQLPEVGSISGGGRYDNLIGGVAGLKETIPAVGMSIGIDRLIAALEELDLIKYDVVPNVIVFNLDESLLDTYLTVVSELRACGINCDFYYAAEGFDKQFKYAESKKINLAIIIGPEEIKKQEVKIKNLSTREQFTVKAGRLAGEVTRLLQL